MTPCNSCGAGFEPKRRDQRFCSKRCCQRFHRNGTEPCTEAGCENLQRARGLCGTHYNRTYFPGSQKIWPAKRATRQRSLKAKTQRRRAATRTDAIEIVHTHVVAARDGWRCGICRRKVNRALHYPHPMSLSLDHIVPLSQGGEHSYANTRLVHLACNHMRSNRGGDEQLMLIG